MKLVSSMPSPPFSFFPSAKNMSSRFHFYLNSGRAICSALNIILNLRLIIAPYILALMIMLPGHDIIQKHMIKLYGSSPSKIQKFHKAVRDKGKVEWSPRRQEPAVAAIDSL